MDIKNMTDEQKYWYLKGYIECFVQDLATDYKITKDQARKMLSDYLSQNIKA